MHRIITKQNMNSQRQWSQIKYQCKTRDFLEKTSTDGTLEGNKHFKTRSFNFFSATSGQAGKTWCFADPVGYNQYIGKKLCLPFRGYNKEGSLLAGSSFLGNHESAWALEYRSFWHLEKAKTTPKGYPSFTSSTSQNELIKSCASVVRQSLIQES